MGDSNIRSIHETSKILENYFLSILLLLLLLLLKNNCFETETFTLDAIPRTSSNVLGYEKKRKGKERKRREKRKEGKRRKRRKRREGIRKIHTFSSLVGVYSNLFVIGCSRRPLEKSAAFKNNR